MTANPYLPPDTEEYSDALLRPERGRAVAIAALVLMTASTVGTALTLRTLFEGLDRAAGTQAPDPETFAAEASSALTLSYLGIAAGLIGGALASWSLFGAGNRECWFFWCGIVVTLLQLVTFPFGTLIGIVLIFGWILRWKEFSPHVSAARSRSSDTHS